MKDEGKEKTQGVAVLGVLRPDGFSYFSKYFAKMSRFNVQNIPISFYIGLDQIGKFQ